MNDSGGRQLNFHPPARGESAPAAGTPRLVIRTCRHISETGDLCPAAAVGGRAHCRGHLLFHARRRKMARARRRAEVLKLPPLADLQAVEAGAALVRVALTAELIDAGSARLLRWATRQAATNLRFMQQQATLPDHVAKSSKGSAGRLRATAKPKQIYWIHVNRCGSTRYR